MKKTLLLIMAMAIGQFIFAQDCSDLFISEYVEGSGNNRAIEIYNPTEEAIDLNNYQLVRYSNGGFEPHIVGLTGSVGSNETYVVVSDKRDPDGTGYEIPIDSALMLVADTFVCPVYEVNKMMYFNGNDAVTLEKDGGMTIVDIFAKIGPPMTSDDNGWGDLNDTTISYMSGGNPTEYTITNYNVGPLFWLAWTKDHTLIRKSNVKQGVPDNPALFNVSVQWDSIPENSFEYLGFHNCDCHESGIADNRVSINVTVFPNPVTAGVLNIDSEEFMTSIELINTIGQASAKEDLDSGTKTYSLNLSTFDRGVYFVKITFKDKNTIIKKIVVE